MCRKDFMGYTCGHCSLPRIVPCPITLSNPRFPLCKYIAEIPMQAPTFCDACNRVAFNQDVLLKEKIHMEEHKNRRCPCGFDYTEEERQNTARLKAENEKKKTFGYGKKYVNGSGYEAPQPTISTQGDCLPLNYNPSSSQQPQLSGYTRSLDQYMNAPYGRHSLQPTHSYHPQHTFPGPGLPQMNGYWQWTSDYPISRGMNLNNEHAMRFREPFIGAQEVKFAYVSDYESADDEGLMAENHFSSSVEDNPYDRANFISSPVAISSGTISPSRRNSSPRPETLQGVEGDIIVIGKL